MRRYPAFRGNWSTTWVAGRYLHEFAAGLTPSKLLNAVLSMAEMKLARPRPLSKPFVLRLEPTGVCNLRCPRCSTGLGIDPRPKGRLALSDLDLLIERVKSHIVMVRLDGLGEPLLHPQIVECIRRFKAAGMGVVLSSHFNNLPAEGVEGLIESGLDRLIVAVDGSTQEIYERYRRAGNLEKALGNLAAMRDAKRRLASRTPFLDLQFLNWGYNAHQIPEMRSMATEYGCDRLTVIEPDQAVGTTKYDPQHPKRCYWLWAVLTVGWQLELHTCTNAWTYSFPKLDLRSMSVDDAWNSAPYVEARRFNRNKRSKAIADDLDCMCNQCTDMLVVPRPPGYVCE